MTIYLVRHAKAGDRAAWPDDDCLRPLSRRGQLQAEALVEQFADAHFDRMLSSPYVRCMETVVPLGGDRGIPVEPVDALAEGASLDDALALVRKHSHHGAVLCTHGDVIPMLLEHYAARGVDIGTDPVCPKGCTWVARDRRHGEVVAAMYLRHRRVTGGAAPTHAGAAGHVRGRPTCSSTARERRLVLRPLDVVRAGASPTRDGNDTTCRSTDARMASE